MTLRSGTRYLATLAALASLQGTRAIVMYTLLLLAQHVPDVTALTASTLASVYNALRFLLSVTQLHVLSTVTAHRTCFNNTFTARFLYNRFYKCMLRALNVICYLLAYALLDSALCVCL
jgi:hypothetical protein